MAALASVSLRHAFVVSVALSLVACSTVFGAGLDDLATNEGQTPSTGRGGAGAQAGAGAGGRAGSGGVKSGGAAGVSVAGAAGLGGGSGQAGAGQAGVSGAGGVGAAGMSGLGGVGVAGGGSGGASPGGAGGGVGGGGSGGGSCGDVKAAGLGCLCREGSQVYCAAGLYCAYESHDCGESGAAGLCVVRPTTCVGAGGPTICGCDAKTYPNACEAHLVGTDSTPTCK